MPGTTQMSPSTQRKIGVAALAVILLGAGIFAYTSQSDTKNSQNNTGSANEQMAGGSIFTRSDVEGHDTSADCWTIINDNVYDLTQWIAQHPGGQEAIIGLCGTDGTLGFERMHGKSEQADASLVPMKIGSLAQ